MTLSKLLTVSRRERKSKTKPSSYQLSVIPQSKCIHIYPVLVLLFLVLVTKLSIKQIFGFLHDQKCQICPLVLK